MRNVMKGIMGFVFSFCLIVAAKAQTDSSAALDTTAGISPDDIICVQVSENVFECGIIEYPDSIGGSQDPYEEMPLEEDPGALPYNRQEEEENQPVDI